MIPQYGKVLFTRSDTPTSGSFQITMTPFLRKQMEQLERSQTSTFVPVLPTSKVSLDSAKASERRKTGQSTQRNRL